MRERHIVSWGMLKKLISNYIDVHPDDEMFTHNRYGKPELCPEFNHSHLFFNMSHSNNVCVVALKKNCPVGVDVEEVKELPDLNDIVEFCLSEYEKSWFFSIPEDMQTQIFYKVWTAKEAFIKAVGIGLSFPLAEVEFALKGIDELKLYRVKGKAATSVKWRLFSFQPFPNYAGSLVTENFNAAINSYNWGSGFAHTH